MKLSISFGRLDAVVWSVLALSAAAVAIMVSVDRRLGVGAVQTYPEHQATAGATTWIGIEFDEPMQQLTVEAGLSIEPEVTGRCSWEGNTLWLAPDVPLEPGQLYRAKIKAGAIAQSGRALQHDLEWEFRVRQPRLVYISPVGEGREIWVQTSEGEAWQLTNSGGTVLDYAVSRDGEWIVYSALNDAGGTSLWLVSLSDGGAEVLVDCGQDRCAVPDWSPDGRWVAYSREEAPSGETGPLGPPRIWTVAIDTGETAALYQDSQVLGNGPSWSPDGARLAFFDGNIGGIRILELKTGQEEVLPSRMGLVGAWSPDGRQMLYNVMQIEGATATAGIFLADLEAREITPFEPSLPDFVDFGRPAWSPLGEWLLIGLRSAGTGPGRQLWILRSDGTEAHPIVEHPEYTHAGYAWCPLGRQIAYQRFPLNVPDATPEVFVIDLKDGAANLVSRSATSPQWAP